MNENRPMKYEPTAVVLTVDDDRAWMTSVGLPATEAQAATLQALIDLDNRASRNTFADLVFGPQTEKVRRMFVYRRLPAIVDNLRTLAGLGINAGKVTKAHPVILQLASGSMVSKFEHLRDVGLDPVKTVNDVPQTLSLASSGVSAKLESLGELGFDGVKVARRAPLVLSLSPTSIRRKAAVLRRLDVDPVRVISAFPTVLGLKDETIIDRFDGLRSLGLDPVRVFTRHPPLLGMPVKAIAEKMVTFTKLGMDAKRIIDVHAPVLSLSSSKVIEKHQHLSQLGVDPGHVIATFPQVLGLSISSVQDKFDQFISLGVDATTLIDVHPPALSYAREKVVLTAMLCHHGGAWEKVRAQWSDGKNVRVLTTPVESLALMAGYEPERFAGNPARAADYAKSRGWRTGDDRKLALAQALRDPAFVNRLGYVAVALDARARSVHTLRPLEVLGGATASTISKSVGISR